MWSVVDKFLVKMTHSDKIDQRCHASSKISYWHFNIEKISLSTRHEWWIRIVWFGRSIVCEGWNVSERCFWKMYDVLADDGPTYFGWSNSHFENFISLYTWNDSLVFWCSADFKCFQINNVGNTSKRIFKYYWVLWIFCTQTVCNHFLNPFE